MLRNIVVGIILLLCAQVLAVAAYFRWELEAERERGRQLELQYNRCMEQTQEKLEKIEVEYLQVMRAAQERMHELEEKAKRRRL